MVLGTVSATNAASQQLRLDYITTKPLSSFSAFKDALPEQQRDLDRHKSAEWHGPEAKYAQNPVIYSHPVAAVVTRRLWAPAHVLPLTSVDN